MRSAVLAIVWENWRLTRLEAAFRLALGILGGAAVLIVSTAGSPNDPVKGTVAATALSVVILANFPIWQSIARLTGGRFLEGYRPGFPFHLLYPRPIPTAVLVGVPMAYDAVSSAILSLISAGLLGLVFGYAFPFLSLAVWISALHLAQAAAQWTTRNRIVQWVGASVAGGTFLGYVTFRGEGWPLLVRPSPVEYAAMLLVGLVSFGLTVAGVARQRRGDTQAAIPRTAASGFADSLVSLFRLRCPTSSAVRAQVWLDVKSSGVPLLTIGVAFAVVNLLVFAAGGPLAFMRPFAVMFSGFSLFALLLLGGNAIFIRLKH
jgi:hypothetical protein